MPVEDHGPTPVGVRGAAAEKAYSVTAEMAERSMILARAESSTEGALCSAFVETPGASVMPHGPVTTYAVDLRASILGASDELLRTKGFVEERVALDMARGVCRIMRADVTLTTTDVVESGPANGHTAGTMWIACTGKSSECARLCRFRDGRSDVRAQTVEVTADLLTELPCMTFR